MAVVFNWMLDRADDSTIVAATDARNPKIRHQLQSIVFIRQADEEQHLENYIMYKAMPSKADIRFPRRKVYGALSNVETVVGVLPAKPYFPNFSGWLLLRVIEWVWTFQLMDNLVYAHTSRQSLFGVIL